MINPFKSLTLLLLLFIVGCNADVAQPGNSRNQLFDFDWKFALTSSEDAAKVDFDDADWRELDLPHDWSIEGEFSLDHPMGNDGGYLPAGIGWYRKTFEVPSKWKGQQISIYFEGVYMDSEVFVNGTSVGGRPYGYSSFELDITPHLIVGKENTIAVKVDNSRQKNSRWYSGSGIYRHVWLKVKNPIHFAQWGVFITTPEVNQDQAIVQVRSLITNSTSANQQIKLVTRITNEQGLEVGIKEQKVDLEANQEKEVANTITVNNPSLWSPATPDLYAAEVIVTQGQESLDQITNAFGIRSIDFSAEEGFTLNGKKVNLFGGCVHHDNGALGAKAYDRAEERKVELLKSAGFNAVRTAHNPPSEAFLDACDKVGLLVIDESFDGWREPKNPFDYGIYFDDWWKKDIESLVLRDRNHPSIIMWSSGNEILERTEPQAVRTANMLNSYIRELDPTRPVTSAMTTWDQGWERFDTLFAQHDVGGYNYQLHRAVGDHERVPSRIILHTESYPRDAFYTWDMVTSHDYIIGDFLWTAMDYLGEAGIGAYYYPGEEADEHWISPRYPWHGAYCGDIDLTGWRKPISHYRNLLWNDNEKLYMAVKEPNPIEGEIRLTGWAVWPTWESWNWPGYEGETLEVDVYSKYPSVRLYLNDTLIGEKPTTREQEFKTTFSVPYSRGTLKAVGVDNDDEKESAILKTAGDAAKITLTADRAEIDANGQDLSFVTVQITDQEGLLTPNAENLLEFLVDGPGEIVGVDNANLKDSMSYVLNKRKAWNGRALVVLKSTKETGDIRLTVNSESLTTSTISIKSAREE